MSGRAGGLPLLVTLGVALAAGAYWYWSSGRKRRSADGSVEEDAARLLELPVIDYTTIDTRAARPEAYLAECKKVAEALHKYGLCVVRDPRVFESDNNRFLDMMERYFELSDGIRDARPDVHFQVGVTPEFTGAPPYLPAPGCVTRASAPPLVPALS